MSIKEGLEEISQTSVANILEVGRRIILKSKNADFTIPEGANIEEDLAAYLGAAIRERKLLKGAGDVK